MPKVRPDVSYPVIDLFSGCGGLSLGFQKAGFTVIDAYDSWSIACECYNANFKHKCHLTDLSDAKSFVKSQLGRSVSGIIGGPPCQDFSHAGKRKEGDRADLTQAYAEIIMGVSPSFFIMENVDRAQNSNAFKKATALFKSSGYGLTIRVLDASLCGVPQKRKRLFCIGILNGVDDELSPYIDVGISKQPMTIRKYFKGTFPVEFYYRHPRNYSRRGVFSVDEPSPTIRGVNRPIPSGYKGHDGDSVPISKEIRALTLSERAQIQTFPSKFKWIGCKTAVEQMIGNAVPVDLAKFVANAVMSYLNESKV